MISIICALGVNRAIGKNNRLLWSMPEDLKHFKDITSGHPIIMGRKTFESIGHPLPNRTNIIITRDPSLQKPGILLASSLDDAIIQASNIDSQEIFIIGGGEIYRQALPFTDKLYLTIVQDSPEADTFFPDYSSFDKILKTEKREYNGLKFEFVELTK